MATIKETCGHQARVIGLLQYGHPVRELPEFFNLRQAIALLAFGEYTHPLEPDRIITWTCHQFSAEGMRRWAECNLKGIAVDQRVHRASLLLCKAIELGRIEIAGDQLITGVPYGDYIDCTRREPIPIRGRPCKVPWEWLGNRGGWLCVQDAREADPNRNEYYCNVRIKSEQLKVLLHNGASHHTPVASTTQTMPAPEDVPTPYRPATRDDIRLALNDVYLNSPGKAPNIKEVCPPVQAVLQRSGKSASHRDIQDVAEEPRYKDQRLKPGQHPKR